MDNGFASLIGRARWLVRSVDRHRWPALTVSAVIALTAALGLQLYHDRFEASARVYVDTETVLKPLMSGMTFQPDIEQQVSMLARTLVSRTNVERLIEDPALHFVPKGVAARERLITRLMKDIKVVPSGSGNLYDISYRGASPEDARLLVDATVNLFVRSGVGLKRADSEGAEQFIDEQIRSYEEKLTEAENRLKEFKIRNFGLTGVSDQDYFARVSKLTDQDARLRIELAAEQQARDSFRRQLKASDLGWGSGVEESRREVLDTLRLRYRAQRDKLDELMRQYTEAHPDVISARRAVDSLQAELRAVGDDLASIPPEQQVRAASPSSPVYQRLRISLAESEAKIASLRSELAANERLRQEATADAGRVPKVEAELAQMNRDYDIIRKNYDVMVARRESALLGMKLDESSRLAEFRVIDPPRVEASPVLPSRLHLALLACVLSLSAGVATAAAIDAARPTFDDRQALADFTGRPVIGAVTSYSTLGADRRSMAAPSAMAAACAGLLLLGWLAWIAMVSHATTTSSSPTRLAVAVPEPGTTPPPQTLEGAVTSDAGQD